MTDADDQRKKLEQAIAAQESLRAALGDAVVDATVAVLRQSLASLGRPALSEERKQVTVLFADVSGFTAMSESMDAEDVRNTMNELWAKLDAAIVKHGGKVDKHIGDAVMALFGTLAAQEDDPERAVRAALEMQSDLADFSIKSRRELKMRIGIHCGPVLLGAVGSNSEFTAMGDTVNLASRLEHAAPIGGILISNDVVRQVWGDFDARELEPITVKGKKEPIAVYLVEKARPRSFRRRRAEIDAPMVGREAELKTLQDALEQAREDSEAQMITLVGEAGVGKSRLLYEFDRWCEKLEDSPWYFMGRSSPQMEKAPYSLLREVLSFRFGILDNDSAAAAREKIEKGVASFLPGDAEAELKAHFIGQLVGLDFTASPHIRGIVADPQQIRDRAFAYLGQLFATAAERRPVVLLLEDVHWADDRSLDAIASLFKTAPRQRLLAICVTRPALFERRPTWGEGQGYHRRVDLKPLSKTDVRRLIGGILGKLESLPQKLRDLIVDEAGGNPFYIEELIRMLVQEGVIVKTESLWRVQEDRLSGLKVPPTLVGVLQARLDHLPPQEREAVQKASVVGRIFWDSALEGLLSGSPEERKSTLDAIRAKEMVFHRESSAFSGSREYIFKHALLRDVAYESVLKRLRPEYHAHVAAWLTAAAAERSGEYASLIAEHYEKAGRAELAAEYLEKAGAQALRISALREARAFLEQALALLSEAGGAGAAPRRVGLLLQLGETLSGMGDYAAAVPRYEQSLESARALGDPKAMAAALTGLCYSARCMGDYAQAQRRGDEGLRLARENSDPDNIIRALRELANNARYQNQLSRASELAEESVRIGRSRDDASATAASLLTLGVIRLFQGEHAAARAIFQETIALCKALGNRRGVADSLNALGMTLTSLRDYEAAQSCFLEGIALAKEIADKGGTHRTLDSLAELEERIDKIPEAQKHCRESLALSMETGAVPNNLTGLALLALLLTKTGEDERALELAGLVLGHPSANNESKSRANAVIERLKDRVSAAASAAALARGKTLPLQDALLRELPKDENPR